MSKTLLIARWEFLATVTRRAYIFTVVAMPLVFGLISAIPVLSTRSEATRSAGVPVAFVDPAGIVDLQLAARLASETSDAAQWQAGFRRGTMALRPDGLIRYDTLQPALADLNARQVSAVYELGADYLASGEIKAYGRGGGMGDRHRRVCHHRRGIDLPRAARRRENLPRGNVDVRQASEPARTDAVAASNLMLTKEFMISD